MKVAIVGCGEIVFAHLRELAFIPSAEVVGVCDIHRALAQDTADLYSISNWYTDYNKMIDELKPDVVHITVPPTIQKKVALDVIGKGCSIYMEKPFCLNKVETIEVIAAAKLNCVLACAGFSYLYDNAPKRFYNFEASGKLGDVVHVEAIYGNDISGNFSKIFLRNKEHWVHSLPGKMFQNIISHSLAQIAPYLSAPLDKISCFSMDYSNNRLLDDELRILLVSGKVTGYVTFSSAIRPVSILVRIYGTKSTIEIDFTNHSFSVKQDSLLPGPLARIRNSFFAGIDLIKEASRNSLGFINGKDRFFTGMGNLFSLFYKSIENGASEPPIPYKDVLVVAEIMDEISRHCMSGSKEEEK